MELAPSVAVHADGRLQRLPLSSLSGCSVIVGFHRSQSVFGPVSLPLIAGPFFMRWRNRRVDFDPRADCIFGLFDADLLLHREELHADGQLPGAEQACDALSGLVQGPALLGARKLVRLGKKQVHRTATWEEPAQHLMIECGE